MSNESQDATPSAFAHLTRVMPRTDFVRRLGSEIGRTAREKMGYGARQPFADKVIELRRLVHRLRQTLVPVQPRPAFKTALGWQLHEEAIRVRVQQQSRWRWLVIGSAVGSLLSLLGVLTALLLRQRQLRLSTDKKTAGVA